MISCQAHITEFRRTLPASIPNCSGLNDDVPTSPTINLYRISGQHHCSTLTDRAKAKESNFYRVQSCLTVCSKALFLNKELVLEELALNELAFKSGYDFALHGMLRCQSAAMYYTHQVSQQAKQ